MATTNQDVLNALAGLKTHNEHSDILSSMASGDRDILLANCNSTSSLKSDHAIIVDRVAQVGSDVARGACANTADVINNCRGNAESVRNTVAQHANHLGEATERNAGEIKNNQKFQIEATKDVGARLAKDICDLAALAGREHAGTRLELCKTAHDLSSQASNNFCTLKAEICDTKYELSKQLAECCCELKQGQSNTNALIREIDTSRVRDELRQQQTENLIMKLAGSGCNGGSA